MQILDGITVGIDTQKIQLMFGSTWRMVRAMPNTAVTVREGATVYCLGPGAEHSDGMIVQKLFSSLGFCARVQESQIGKKIFVFIIKFFSMNICTCRCSDRCQW